MTTNKYSKKMTVLIWSGLFGIALTGCASNTKINRAVEQDFGNAAKHLVEIQAVDNPDEAAGPPLDGALGERVMGQYRKDFAKPKEINNTININVGN